MENKYVHEAYSAIFQQDFQKAIAFFRKAIQCNPKNHSLYYKLSVTYARNKEFDKAIEGMKEAIRLAGENQTYHIHLQDLLIRKLAFDAKKALETKEGINLYIDPLKQYISIDPLQLELKYILGSIYFHLGKHTKAEEQMIEILKVDHDHPQALQYFEDRSDTHKDVH